MNVLKTIRNNWKKSAFAAVASAYGMIELKEHIQITQHMRSLCNEVANIGLRADNQSKNILVVVNPVAKKKDAEKAYKKYCEPILHLAGYSVETLRTKHIGHAKSFIEELKTLPDVIVIAGGDGTTSEVVTGLMRRPGHPCPIALLPLGRTSQSASKYLNLTSCEDVDYIKALSGALLPLLQGKFKYENVIQYDVLSDGGKSSLKPIYGLNKFSWGLMKEIDSAKDKYWYFGSLRHYAAAFLKSFSKSLHWNFEADYIYTEPCPGCSNCYIQKQTMPSSGSFISKFITPKSNGIDAKKALIKNDSCKTTYRGHCDTNQLNIACSQNDQNYAELESKFINSLQPGWEFIKNVPNVTKNKIAPTLILKSRTIELYPSPSVDTENVFYSIDGEEYDARPIKMSIIPNAIKVFC